jgi:hypothetical protein
VTQLASVHQWRKHAPVMGSKAAGGAPAGDGIQPDLEDEAAASGALHAGPLIGAGGWYRHAGDTSQAVATALIQAQDAGTHLRLQQLLLL